DRGKVGFRERQTEGLNLRVDAGAQLRNRRLRQPRTFDVRDDLVQVGGAPRGERGRNRAAKQQAQIVDPRLRQREQRLEEQMQQEVVAAQIDDESHRWLDL